jgi:hypothetical protein
MFDTASRLIAQPDWLLDHARLYGALAQTEAQIAARDGARRALLALVALAGAAVALNLAGVALLMAASRAGEASAGLLVAVPALPALVALVAAWWARRPPAAAPFEALRGQLAADVRWLQALQQPEAADAAR